MGLFAVLLAGCAHVREEVRSTRTTSTVTAEPAPETIEREVIAIDSAPPPEVVPVARPRLAQTITLGQGAEQPYIPAAPPQARAGSASSNVVVNNTIVVQGGAPAYYGGYGYGRAPSFYGGGESRSFGTRPSTTPQWGATGWEGARRTAAPGQTPAIGGNWSPAPSYGPAQMK